MKNVLSVLLMCVILRVQGSKVGREAKYPRFERSCYRNMPVAELNDCLKFNFQQNIPRFRSGIPGMMNESIDPLFWPKFDTRFGGSVVRGGIFMKDINFWGWSDLKILDIRSNVKDPLKMIFEIDWKLPKLSGDGRFLLDGRIGAFGFTGDGPFAVNLTEVTSTWRVVGRRKAGEPYMKIVSLRGRPEIATFKMKASNTVVGNEQMDAFVTAVINRTWRVLVEIATPTGEKMFQDFAIERLNKVFLSVPYDELFPLEKPQSRRH